METRLHYKNGNMSEEQNSEKGLPARLTVWHSHEDDFGGRSIHLLLDGEKIATLPTGQSITRELEPGQHHLRADNTFVKKTIEFDIQPGEHLQYRMWNRTGFGSWMIGVFGSGPLYLMVEQQAADVTTPAAEKE